jgi:hypothetical protein
MLNLAGSSYDFGNVLFAVLQECEHRRRALLPNQGEQALMEIARQKLAEVRDSYEESGGTRPYWEDLEREVLTTAMPEYIAKAVEQTRLEKEGYGVWRGGDPAARAVFGLIGLIIGGLILEAPFIPIWEKSFAFVLAAAGFLYPEIKKGFHDYRFSRFLNRLIVQAEKYQKNSKIHYMSNARLEEEFRALDTPAVKSGEEGAKVHPFPKEPEGGSGPGRSGQRLKG